MSSVESASRFFRGLGYSLWVGALVLLIAYAGLVVVAVITNDVEDDRAPALLIALAVLAASTAISALLVAVKRFRGRLGPGGLFAGSMLTCTSLAFTVLGLLVGLAATGHS
jgi:hypothetical protein